MQRRLVCEGDWVAAPPISADPKLPAFVQQVQGVTLFVNFLVFFSRGIHTGQGIDPGTHYLAICAEPCSIQAAYALYVSPVSYSFYAQRVCVQGSIGVEPLGGILPRRVDLI